MDKIVFRRAVPFTRPIPKRKPTDTCLVDTGRPSRLATVTMKAVIRLAVKPWPGNVRRSSVWRAVRGLPATRKAGALMPDLGESRPATWRTDYGALAFASSSLPCERGRRRPADANLRGSDYLGSKCRRELGWHRTGPSVMGPTCSRPYPCVTLKRPWQTVVFRGHRKPAPSPGRLFHSILLWNVPFNGPVRR